MSLYFLALDAAFFIEHARPALAESWLRRSFHPCQDLCATLTPAARLYAERYHTGDDEPLLCRVAAGLPFDRSLWRALVGETLLYGAVEIPEFQCVADTLCCLLAPANYRADVAERARLAPIQQVHLGVRDLTFGPAVYRPAHAGYNDREDVRRLTAYLEAVDPQQWTTDGLRELREPLDDEGRADELAFAQEWFPALRAFYQRCRDQDRVLAIESIF
jgi:hypothetical protein